MGSHRYLISLFILFIFLQSFCTAIDTITSTKNITDSQTITSSGQIFKLGFFTPANSKNRYVGIWYNKISVQTIVWIANRNNPLSDASGVLTVSDAGNLVVLDGDLKVLWSTNVSNIISSSSSAELLDSGNLVLRETGSNGSSSSNNQGRILWQSFDNPSDTFLPEMKFGTNLRTGEKQILRAWKGDSDPSEGNFTAEIEPLSIPQLITLNGSRRYWRSGPWNNRIFIGIPTMYSVYLDGFNINRDDPEGAVYLTLSYVDKSIIPRYVLDSNGNLKELRWNEEEKKWQEVWLSLENECDDYGKCGKFGSCNKLDSPICSCLRGFVPKVPDEWSKGDWSSGCMRRTELQCKRNSTNGIADGFLKIERVKVPDNVNWHEAEVLEACEATCINNCSCSAYSYDTNIGCMSWTGDLIDIQKFARAGVDLNIRVANSELDAKKDVNKVIIITTVLIGMVTISVCIYMSWRWITKHRGRKQKNSKILLFNVESPYSESSVPDMLGDNPDFKFFNFEKLIIATNNFSESNKLGHGGFGSVYKGELPDGKLIAVKRLSKSSGQGSLEFKNEVVVISKLQHRNLVRLLGCCIAGEEKILIYEYMPNNSLDTYLFDPTKRGLLDWRKCFQIIEGISRGILYLHRDSRLKVIHRDLKASNVLLDEELNPKISDFGMARIFGSNEFEANTNRVVGTYGYMSPEYAMEGQFSEKSDVFSFGVLLLEIVSGRKNTSFYNHDQSLSLVKYAWLLWNNNEIQALIEPTLSTQALFELEIVRCIHVGLLCVQEFANDRPTMSTTLSMLTSEIATLPTPKQPAFTQRHPSSTHSSSHEQNSFSINTVTLTSVGGR